MPLRRVEPGTIPRDEEPRSLRDWKRYIERDLEKEYGDYRNLLGREGAGRFSRPIDPRIPFGNSFENAPSDPNRARPMSLRRDDAPYDPNMPDRKESSYRIMQARGMQSAGKRTGDPVGAVLHYSGSNDDTIDGLVASSRNPMRRAYGYNWVIDQKGNVYQMTPLNEYTHHIEGPSGEHRTNKNFPYLDNRNTVSIAILGDGTNDSPEALKALDGLLNDMASGYQWLPKHIIGHGELQGGAKGNKRIDEGNYATKFRQRYEQAYLNRAPIEDLPPPQVAARLPAQETYGTQDILRLMQQDEESQTRAGAGEAAPTPSATVSSAPAKSSSGIFGSFDLPQIPKIEPPPPLIGGTLGEGLRKGGASMMKASSSIASGAQAAIQGLESGGIEKTMGSLGGPETAFPELPPPPPRAPPGGRPPIVQRRR